MMKKWIVFLLVAMGKFAHAQLKPVDNGSSVQFKVKNLGFSVTGAFTGLSGTIRFDPNHPEEAAFDVNIDANTVNTDNGMRDDHLRKSSYLDVQGHPRIHLQSEKITASGHKGSFVFAGQLTIKEKTLRVSFPFTAESTAGGYVFKGAFSINRKDFDVGGTSTISDKVDLVLSVTAK